MTNPLDIIKINDIKLTLEALKGNINTIVSDVILDNATKLKQRTAKTCEEWKVTQDQLLSIKKTNLNKFLLEQALKKPLNIIHENLQLASEEELRVNQMPPTYENAPIQRGLLATYLQTRAGLHFGNKGEKTKCPYCPGEPNHTYMHCINDCQFPLTKQKRNKYEEKLAQTGQTIPIASIGDMITAISSETTSQLQYYLDMIKTSPFLEG
jgi:hypothetical protein